MRRVYLALGSNLGDREDHLRRALDALRAGGIDIDAVSSLYETPPWGVEDQPPFLNIAAAGNTEHSAREILALAKRIEADAGRDFEAPRWTARPIDVDIALIEGETVDDPDLIVPHRFLAERSFVLVPLAEIAPVALHPHLNLSIAALRDARPAEERAEVRMVRDVGWYQGERRAL